MRAIAIAALGVLAAAGTAAASTLSVAPVRVELSSTAPIAVLTVRNQDDSAVVVQARPAAWSQTDDHDQLDDTHDLLVTPPLFTIPPQGTADRCASRCCATSTVPRARLPAGTVRGAPGDARQTRGLAGRAAHHAAGVRRGARHTARLTSSGATRGSPTGRWHRGAEPRHGAPSDPRLRRRSRPITPEQQSCTPTARATCCPAASSTGSCTRAPAFARDHAAHHPGSLGRRRLHRHQRAGCAHVSDACAMRRANRTAPDSLRPRAVVMCVLPRCTPRTRAVLIRLAPAVLELRINGVARASRRQSRCAMPPVDCGSTEADFTRLRLQVPHVAAASRRRPTLLSGELPSRRHAWPSTRCIAQRASPPRLPRSRARA